jgi:hypothetical protein
MPIRITFTHCKPVRDGAGELHAGCGHGRRTLVIRRAPADLVSQMRAVIAEEAFLWELTEQMTDCYDGGKTVVHGPWQADDCRQVLLRWFDRGLLDCIAYNWGTAAGTGEIVHYQYQASWRSRASDVGEHLILHRQDAPALLGDPWPTSATVCAMNRVHIRLVLYWNRPQRLADRTTPEPLQITAVSCVRS